MAKKNEQLWETAREAWPTIDVTPERFAAFLAARTSDDWDAMHVADLYLACACADGHPQALAAFESQHLSRLSAALSRGGSSSSTIDEVLQRVRVEVLVRDGERGPGIEGYRGKSDLSTWLRVVGIRETARVEKRERRELLGYDESAWINVLGSDPELSYLKEHYRKVVARALKAAVSALSTEELELLRGHLIDGLNIDQLGERIQVHRATAARRLERARERLCKAIRAELKQRLRISAAEIDEVFRLVRSRLDVSMRRVLLAPP